MRSVKQKVAIITAGYFPVPATRGGAVENLVENLTNENEKEDKVELTVFSSYDEKAEKLGQNYENTIFEFIKTPKVVQKLDLLIYNFFAKVVKKEKHMSYRYILQRLYFINRVAMFLKKNDYDRVVIENHPTLFMALKKHKNYLKYRGKYYYHLHNKADNLYGCDEIIKQTYKVLGVSNYINETLAERLGKTDIKYEVLPNRIDSTKFRADFSAEELENVKKRFGISQKEQVVVFSGRLNKEKGIKELLLAWKKLKRPNTKLLIVGSYYFASGMESDYEKELKALTDSMKDQIIFSGYIEYEKIPKLLAIADVVVAPSIWDEPACLSVIEAISMYKPLITTFSGGIPEYADNKSSVILPNDESLVDNIAESLADLLDDDKKRQEMTELLESKTKDWGVDQFYNNFVSEMER
ncbi:glycosyltransferase family 4 protein [Ligilactobacillus animalis]|uniref:glycosyltransferase family 4 protein n=1 Tax=Ligilactobacillus animalis TaxID=1605 RepID=UPI00049846A8